MKMSNNEVTHDVSDDVKGLFAKVTSVEDSVNNPSADEDARGESLHLYGICMGIMAESTVVELTPNQRREFNTRMNQIELKIQEQALNDFMNQL
jgi:hypothetical protein